MIKTKFFQYVVINESFPISKYKNVISQEFGKVYAIFPLDNAELIRELETKISLSLDIKRMSKIRKLLPLSAKGPFDSLNDGKLTKRHELITICK